MIKWAEFLSGIDVHRYWLSTQTYNSFWLDKVTNQPILSKLLLMNYASDSSGKHCRDSIYSKFTLSCIGHVIDSYKYEKGSDHVYFSHFIFYILNSGKFQ